MNKYKKALIGLVSMLSGGLRKEYLNNPKINEYLETLNELIDEHKKYISALDKACDILETYDLVNNELTRPKQTKDDWKEWALKDESVR